MSTECYSAWLAGEECSNLPMTNITNDWGRIPTSENIDYFLITRYEAEEGWKSPKPQYITAYLETLNSSQLKATVDCDILRSRLFDESKCDPLTYDILKDLQDDILSLTGMLAKGYSLPTKHMQRLTDNGVLCINIKCKRGCDMKKHWYCEYCVTKYFRVVYRDYRTFCREKKEMQTVDDRKTILHLFRTVLIQIQDLSRTSPYWLRTNSVPYFIVTGVIKHDYYCVHGHKIGTGWGCRDCVPGLYAAVKSAYDNILQKIGCTVDDIIKSFDVKSVDVIKALEPLQLQPVDKMIGDMVEKENSKLVLYLKLMKYGIDPQWGCDITGGDIWQSDFFREIL